MRYVNLGCGSRYHADWINIDIEPLGPGVIAHDLGRGIPLEDASCDVVYHSHVLEHIRRADAARFLVECHRVLKPGGIIRVVVPDLEGICRTYLEKLEGALEGDAAACADYEWMMLELIDQTTRERSGGMMGEYVRRPALANEAFVLERIGEEGRKMMDAVRKRAREAAQPGAQRSARAPVARSNGVRSLGGRVRRRLLNMVLGEADARALAIGRFRLAGEVHQWMYDRHSLALTLRDAGFADPTVRTATSSAVDGWAGFHLDTLEDGRTVKPDSLFMEAIKPRPSSVAGDHIGAHHG